MLHLLAVGCGGFVGAISRYVITGFVQNRFPNFLPAGTFVVNALGCFFIGFLMMLVIDSPESGQPYLSPNLRLFLITGILGSLTTFSTFGYETVELLREERFRWAVFYLLANLGVGLPAVVLGRQTARVFGF